MGFLYVVHASLLETWERGYNVFAHCIRLNTIFKRNSFNEQTLCHNWQRRLCAYTAPFVPVIDENNVFNAVLNEQFKLGF